MPIESVQDRKIVEQIKSEALTSGTPESFLQRLSGVDFKFGFFTKVSHVQEIFAQAAKELADGRKAVTQDDAGATQVATTDAAQDAPLDPVAAMKQATAELKSQATQAKQEADVRQKQAAERAQKLNDGFPELATSDAVKTFADFVMQKFNPADGETKRDEAVVVPLLEYELPKVELDPDDFSGVSDQMAGLLYTMKYSGVREGTQQIVMTPHGLRLHGEKSHGSERDVTDVDVAALGNAGVSLEQLQGAVSDAMQKALSGAVTTTTVKIPRDDRLATSGISEKLPDSTWNTVVEGLNNRYFRRGAQQIINDIAEKAPTMTALEFAQYAAGTLNMIGNAAQHRDGGDYRLPLAHRDILAILHEVGVQAQQNFPEAKKAYDFTQVTEAALYVQGKCRSDSTSYKTFEPNGEECKDVYTGWYELWDSLTGLGLPSMGPGWGLARDLGWTSGKSLAKELGPEPKADT